MYKVQDIFGLFFYEKCHDCTLLLTLASFDAKSRNFAYFVECCIRSPFVALISATRESALGKFCSNLNDDTLSCYEENFRLVSPVC